LASEQSRLGVLSRSLFVAACLTCVAGLALMVALHSGVLFVATSYAAGILLAAAFRAHAAGESAYEVTFNASERSGLAGIRRLFELSCGGGGAIVCAEAHVALANRLRTCGDLGRIVGDPALLRHSCKLLLRGDRELAPYCLRNIGLVGGARELGTVSRFADAPGLDEALARDVEACLNELRARAADRDSKKLLRPLAHSDSAADNLLRAAVIDGPWRLSAPDEPAPGGGPERTDKREP
jgi:hypothetical protein